jgi:Domain of unknown function (DUF4157)
VATDVASGDAERNKSDNDSAPKSVDERRDSAGAGSTAPVSSAGTAGGLGQRQIRAKAAQNASVSQAGDDAERKADVAADHVMRAPDPVTPTTPAATSAAGASAAGPASAGPTGATPAGGSTAGQPVQRSEDPTAEQRRPGTPTAKPATENVPGGTGVGPDTATPAGPAPLVAAPISPTSGPAETGTPAPDPEPPAPEGEAPARETPQVPNDVQEYLDASRGKGAPLPEAPRKIFEAKFQRPFDDVGIHDDTGADDAAKKIDALAFTRGNDIYFRAGAYDPTSPEGKRLLAHELAHVVQQRPGVNRKVAGLGGAMVYRARKKEHDPKGGGTNTKADVGGNVVDFTDPGTGKLKLNEVKVPAFKVDFHNRGNKLFWNKKAVPGDKFTVPRTGAHDNAWRTDAAKKLVDAVKKKAGQKNPPHQYQFGKAKSEQRFYLGTADDVAYALAVLPWDQHKNPTSFDIDHQHEMLLGGDETKITNLWLLEQGINRSSGPAIEAGIVKDITAFLESQRPKLARVPSIVEVKGWAAAGRVTFDRAVALTDSKAKSATVAKENVPKWELDDFDKIDGTPGSTAQKSLEPLDELKDENRDRIVGTEQKIALYSRRGGGKAPRSVGRKGDALDTIYGPGFVTTNGTYSKPDPGQPGGGSVTLGMFARNKAGKIIRGDDGKAIITPLDVKFDIEPMAGVEWGGLIDTTAMAKQMQGRLSSPKTSPIALSSLEFDLEEGLQARAQIPRPSIPMLENIQIDVFMSGADVGLQALMTAGALKMPGPLTVSGGALLLTASIEQGLKIEGQVDFLIQKLATGYIKAKVGTSQDFALEAELQFDKKLFSGDAKIRGSYEKGAWAVEGTLAVGPDRIKGIKKASIGVKVTAGEIIADGEFETSIKGVDKGKLGFKYTEATGTEITGEIILGKGIPGIKSGKLDATIKDGPEGQSLSGDAILEPSIPGLTGSITGRYDNGAFLVLGDLAYEKGLAKGSVKVGVTNQEVDAEGKTTGRQRTDGALTVFGAGVVTLTLTPWLTGTVGLKLMPNGEIEVSGEVALPPTFEVFKEQPLEKQLLSLGLDIPLLGVAVAGQRIGIFATIRGSVSILAGVGPGQLRDVAIKVTYNPNRPDDTTVSGNARFVVPAHAGLRLTVDGGLGAGIPVVSATAGISVYGEIGLAGEASAGVAVSWTPRSGIALDARGEVFVEPKFKFGVDAFVDVSADLWLTTIELYHQKWKLAAFEYGSNLRFGLSMPIHYESSKPFEISFDQIQWTFPHIEPKELLSGLMKQIIG